MGAGVDVALASSLFLSVAGGVAVARCVAATVPTSKNDKKQSLSDNQITTESCGPQETVV
jgi:hypothetical protein